MKKENAIIITLTIDLESNSINFVVKTGEKYSGILERARLIFKTISRHHNIS